MTRKQLIALLVTVAALAAAVIGAWALDSRARSSDAEYAITVVSGDDVLATFDREALEKLGVKRVMMEGGYQEGPTLLSVLEAAGVRDYSTVTVLGQGVRDDGVIVLAAADVDEYVLLDFAVRGTAKLAGPDMAWEDRVRDVTRIEVR